jgi:hypothetical protein
MLNGELGVPLRGVMLNGIDPVKSVALFPNASWAATTTGGAIIVAVTVFVPTTVPLIVPAICPLEPLVSERCVKVASGSAIARATVAPFTGLPNASRTVTGCRSP